jgi:uncharacterized membrane protein
MAAAKKETKTSSTSANQANLTAALTYLAGWVTGLIFLLVEKDDDFVRFHAAQSLTVFGPLTLVAFVPILGPVVNVLLFPITLVLWIVLMVKAYQGERFKLPVVGDYAEQVKNKIGK